MQSDSPPITPEPSALARVLDYHARTKHRMDRYAAGPETLDWEALPAPFRHYHGAERVALPLLSELPESDPAARALTQPLRTGALGPRHEWTLATLGVLLQASFGITAWKSWGPDRWALRANPSSGNLHPVETYVIAQQLPFLADGVYHYEPEQHALELRARWSSASTSPPSLRVALTSLMWREAWKYGERAFRYCQLDVGHACAALAIAARTLGAEVSAAVQPAHAQLSQLLGLDREQDFATQRAHMSEREEPELVLHVACGPSAAPAAAWPDPADLEFFGTASRIDPRPMYRWPVITEVALATRSSATTQHALVHTPESAAPASTDVPSPNDAPAAASARSVLLGRRSAQRFDPSYRLPWPAFRALLSPLMPERTGPFRALPSAARPAIDLVLFVHRVSELEPGLYLLPRRGAHSAELLARLSPTYTPEPVALGAPDLPLVRLCAAEPRQLMRVARALHCHQDIAATSCFALGMIAQFEERLARDPGEYRELFREAGLIGQLLYVHAEAQGVRGTGVGCYFDDAVHELLGLQDSAYQSLYHFTVGFPIEDLRLETGPAYPGRQP